MIKTHLKDVELSKIIPYPKNYKKNTDFAVKKLAESIDKLGYLKTSITVDENMIILTGHTTVKALDLLGYPAVPEVDMITGLTEEEKTAYRIADNRIALLDEVDEEALLNEINELSSGMSEYIGMSEKEISILRDKFLLTDGMEEEEPVDIETVETDIMPGDLIEIGNHRILCGDVTDPDSMCILMGNVRADMVFTDPPYNVNYGNVRPAERIHNDCMNMDEYRDFLTNAFSNIRDYSKTGAVIYVCHADVNGYYVRGALADSGWSIRSCIIWIKNNIVRGRQDYHWRHEPIIYGWNSDYDVSHQPILYGWKDDGSHEWFGGRKQSTTWYVDMSLKNKDHPTMKPIALMAIALKNSSKSGDVILDCFAGSGSTLIAAELLGRSCYCMELDPRYCQVIVNRYRRLTEGAG
jgi:DNA modification methylase